MKSIFLCILTLCLTILIIPGCTTGNDEIDNSIETSCIIDNLDPREFLKNQNSENTITNITEAITDESDFTNILYLNQLDDLYGYTVIDVGPFHNGIARYEIKTADVMNGDTKYEDGQYGYVDKNGRVKILPIYSDAPERYENPAYVEYNKNGNSYSSWNVGFDVDDYNFNWEFKFEDNMEKYGTSSNGLFWVLSCEEQLSGDVYSMTYYNTNGKKLHSFKNASYVLGQSNEGLTLALSNISYSYQNNSNFNDYGYALVEFNNKTQLIDKQFNTIDLTYGGDANIDYNVILDKNHRDSSTYLYKSNFTDLEILNLCGNIACVDITFDVLEIKTGDTFQKNFYTDVIIDYNTKSIRMIRDWCTCTSLKGTYEKCGNNYLYQTQQGFRQFELLNEKGTVIVDIGEHPDFQGAVVFDCSVSEEGYATILLRNENKTVFSTILNSQGNIVMPPSSKTQTLHVDRNSYVANPVQDGLCAAKDTSTDLYGYINTNGEWVIKPQFSHTESFSEGLAFVDNAKVIDKSGNTVFYIN